MSASGVWLIVLLICVIVDTLVEGNSWRRHHGHHSRPQYHGLENSMSLNLLPKYPRNSEGHSRYYDIYQQRGRPDYQEARADSFPSLEYEDTDKVRVPVVHRRRQIPRNPLLMRQIDTRSKYQDDAKGTRRVRHSGYLEARAASFPSLEYEDAEVQNAHRRRQVRQGDREQLLKAHEKSLSRLYELEVRQVQNKSICSYTVVPDVKNSRVPKVLEHIKCNRVGSNCLGTNTHCCIQTFKYIEVFSGIGHNKTKNTIKHYVGCVCAFHVLQQQKKVAIDN